MSNQLDMYSTIIRLISLIFYFIKSFLFRQLEIPFIRFSYMEHLNITTVILSNIPDKNTHSPNTPDF